MDKETAHSGRSASSCHYSLPFQGRALCSCSGKLNQESWAHTYVAATCSPRWPNQIHVIEHVEHTNEVNCLSVMSHPEEVRAIMVLKCSAGSDVETREASSESASGSSRKLPIDSNSKPDQEDTLSWKLLLLTGYRVPYSSKEERCRLYSSLITCGTPSGDLELLADVDDACPFYRIRRLLPCPHYDLTSQRYSASQQSAELSYMAIVDAYGFRVFDVHTLQRRSVDGENRQPAASEAHKASNSTAIAKKVHQLTGDPGNLSAAQEPICASGCFDPHHSRVLLTVGGCSLNVWDIRSNKLSSIYKNLHQTANLLDVDCNPNIPHQVLTTGEDGSVKIWDVREMDKRPLQACKDAHSHWVLCARFNPYHDQMIATAGTDSAVKLWNTRANGNEDDKIPLNRDNAKSGFSEADSRDFREGLNVLQAPDSRGFELFRFYEGHEDSVYGLSWSASDAWGFASLSNEGRILFNEVPSEEKYKILL